MRWAGASSVSSGKAVYPFGVLLNSKVCKTRRFEAGAGAEGWGEE